MSNKFPLTLSTGLERREISESEARAMRAENVRQTGRLFVMLFEAVRTVHRHCAGCGESFDNAPEVRDGLCEGCLDERETYAREQAQQEYEYCEQGGDEDRNSGR